MICGRIKMIIFESGSCCYPGVRTRRRDRESGSNTGSALRVPFCCSLINPASSTVWPFATRIELLTFRSDTVGVRLGVLLLLVGTLLISCSTSRRTLPLTLMRGDTRQDNAGVAIIDRVHDGIACRQHRGAAGGDRHGVTDLKRWQPGC